MIWNQQDEIQHRKVQSTVLEESSNAKQDVTIYIFICLPEFCEEKAQISESC